MSSLFSGSPLSLPPSAITAIVPSFDTHGTKQCTPRSRHADDFFAREAATREGIVEVHRLSAAKAMPDARFGVDRRQQRRKSHRLRRHIPARRVVAERREHQAHAIEHERLDDAADEPLAQTLKIEVAVEIAREADQRLPIVVAVAVVGAIERHLNRVLDDRREQHDDERRQHRDDRVVLAGAAENELAGELEQHGVDRRDRHDRRRIDDRALDDDLDVHQPVADDRRGERERHERQRNRQQAKLRTGLEAGHPGHQVAGNERQRADRRAADDPPELTARGHRLRAAAAPAPSPPGRRAGRTRDTRARADRARRASRRTPRRRAAGRVSSAARRPTSSSAGRYMTGSVARPIDVRTHAFGRSGKTSAKCRNSGGSSTSATTSAQ